MKFFRFTVPKNFIKKRFIASLNLGIEINRDKRGARITIYRQIFFSHSGKNIRRGNLARFRKFLVLKIFMHKRGVSHFSFKKFMSHSAEKVCRGILQCFTFFEFAKVLCIRGVCHDFLSKSFGLTILEILVVEPFCVSEKFWYQIIFWIRGGGGGLSRFSVRNFLSPSAEKFHSGTFLCCVSENFR